MDGQGRGRQQRPRTADTADTTTTATAAAVGVVLAFLMLLAPAVVATSVVAAEGAGADGTAQNMACAERLPTTHGLPVVRLAMGSPPRTYEILVLFEAALGGDPATKIHSDRVFDSSTIACVDAVCYDQVLLRTRRAREALQTSFVYEVDPTAAALGLDGAIRLGDGSNDTTSSSVLVTQTRVCWPSSPSSPSSAPAGVAGVAAAAVAADGALTVSLATAQVTPALATTPAATACTADAAPVVDLFPASAVVESTWLVFTSDRYEAHSAVETRRAQVEASLACEAVANSSGATSSSRYAMECAQGVGACRNRPAIPFRRVQHDLQLSVQNASTVMVAFQTPASPVRTQTRNAQFFNSVIRLAVLVIVAFVTFSRAATTTSSAPSVFAAALSSLGLRSKSPNPPRPPQFVEQVAEAVVGGFALAARLAVLLFRFDEFVHDRAGAILVGFELVGIVASAVAFAARLALVSPLPITLRVGGSSALIDASQTALLTVIVLPVDLVATQFDATVRFLAAALLSAFAIHRAIFSSAAASTMALVAILRPRRFEMAFAALASIVAMAWWAQLAALGISLGVGFALPQALHTTRASREPIDLVAIAIFFCAVCAQLPFLNRSVLRLLRIL